MTDSLADRTSVDDMRNNASSLVDENLVAAKRRATFNLPENRGQCLASPLVFDKDDARTLLIGEPSPELSRAVKTEDGEDGLKVSYAPPKKPKRDGPRAKYTSLKTVDTRTAGKPSEWYANINVREKTKFSRSDLQSLSKVKDLIQNCIDAMQNSGDLAKQFTLLRADVHKLEIYHFIAPVILKKSKILEGKGLQVIFNDPQNIGFPWDIKADALALQHRWMNNDLDSHLLRGIRTETGRLASGAKRTSHKLDKSYTKRPSNFIGHNDLVNGQWWFSRICALRDGAHGEQEAGIHGQTGRGAFSVVVASGGYDDKDYGEVCAINPFSL